MRILKAIIGWVLGVIAGMAGGQGKIGGKAPRRFGLPVIAISTGWSFGWSWKYLAFLLFIPILSMGYGHDSVLMGWIGVEWLVRAVYAAVLALPFFVFGLWRGVCAVGVLVAAFLIHAGSLGHVEWFGDFLIEDVLRYGALMGLVLFNVMRRNT